MISTAILYLFAGLVCGILINYLSDVLPVDGKLTYPVCASCGQPFQWKEYLAFMKCTHCGHPRSLRSFLVPLMVATLFVLLTISPPRHLAIPLACCAYAYFCLVVVIDLEHKVVVTSIALVGVVLGLGIGYMLKGFTLTLLGGLIGGGIMLALYLLGILFVKLISKSRGEPVDEVALGLGDVYISVVLGLMLGWPVIGYNLLLAVMLGGLVSALVIGYHAIRKSFQAFMAIPYVPFLVGVAAILLYIQK